jgi:asparagine synthetase B (glutamine-hydrolysing)
MEVDRDALEMVLQTGGEMFRRSVFGMPDLAPPIVCPPQHLPESGTRLTETQLGELVHLLEGAACRSLDKYHGKEVGFTLSGGVDSSLLLYLIKRVYPDIDIVAYHTDWGFAPRSELRFAKLAADFVGVKLRVVDVSPKAQLAHIEEALPAARTLSYSTVAVYMVFQTMARDGMDVAVNALGLDELFAGYTVHRRFYNRSRIRFVPPIRRLTGWNPYRYACFKWGIDKAFFMADNLPDYASRMVRGSTIDLSEVYDQKIASKDLWTDIHKWILWAMVSNFANAISRCARPHGLSVVYPYMDHPLMKQCLQYSPIAKMNKAPIRYLMRNIFHFPEDIPSRGERWDKIGWGGSADPYFAKKEYMSAVQPRKDTSREWFTSRGLSEYRRLGTKPTVRALLMALFLKTLEVI